VAAAAAAADASQEGVGGFLRVLELRDNGRRLLPCVGRLCLV
jgi:hypothetical protein